MTTIDQPAIDPSRTLGELVTERPGRARVFEAAGIDYCCHGSRPLSEAADEAGIDVSDIAAQLAAVAPPAPAREIGRASCRERVCQYVLISVVAVLLKKKNYIIFFISYFFSTTSFFYSLSYFSTLISFPSFSLSLFLSTLFYYFFIFFFSLLTYYLLFIFTFFFYFFFFSFSF